MTDQNLDKTIKEKEKEKDQALEMLKIVSDVRKFEIDLFWRRSLFFWGFATVIITAFGYAYTNKLNKEVQLLIACCGIVCSLIWSLVNRGSKFWQKQWEDKIIIAEKNYTGSSCYFHTKLEGQKFCDFLSKLPWDAGYSVSKLTTTFSDLTMLFWILVAIYTLFFEFISKCFNGFTINIIIIFITIITVIYIFWRCPTSSTADPNPPARDSAQQ
ncbi:MAG: hypothetical protein QM533_05795 [Cytophagales bacterium]|nr:hypothetical protein [Cytophagales bacterium]